VELRREQALELPAALAAALAALVLALPGTAGAGTTTGAPAPPASPVYDADGNVIGAPFVPRGDDRPRLVESQAIAIALGNGKVAGWVRRYEGEKVTEAATFDADTGLWEVKVWGPPDAGQIVLARVDDTTTRVTEAWTGPQVAWKMARGYDGAFGRKINDPWIWLSLSVVFFLGLADLRRPLSLRNLDLAVLLSFSLSLLFFNRGEVFRAMPLAYPPLLYLLGRAAWIGWRGRGTRAARPLWPVWLLLAATVFLTGFRIGLNAEASNVIDVGFAGVVGAQRIVDQGEMPYGHMPTDEGKECGAEDSEGYVRDRIQTNGRCEAAIGRGDTYGPVTYYGYIPGFALFGWSGKWDDLPAAHFTSILFDLLALAGLALVGRRFGGTRLAVTLAFAWAAYPFTQYVSSSNSNDAIMPALLVWGFWLLSSPAARGGFLAVAAAAKFAALLVAPLWASYPRGLDRPAPRRLLLFGAGFLLATALSFWVLLLEPDPLHAARVFWDRTFGWQLSRPSPFSIWDWDEYRYPDLAVLQGALKVVLVVAAVALYFVPREKSPLQMAALTAALLLGFELVLTHWFYLYIVWFFPFLARALLAPYVPRRPPEPEEEPPPHGREIRELVPTG
jgi:hypothetical protein